MRRFVVLVLDGLGIGAMDDVADVRPNDCGANTLRHILETVPNLKLPHLESMGLMNAAGFCSKRMSYATAATYGTSNLMHFGADTFFGHQEIMGTKPQKPFGEPFSKRIAEIEKVLFGAGYVTEKKCFDSHELLLVNNAVTVADNIECDPGQAFNVTATLDDIGFDEVVKIGRLVRCVSQVPRVIAFGGRKVTKENLLKAVEVNGDYIGVNAPKSGVYNHDYHCLHIGYGVDPTVQLPKVLGNVGVPVVLLGKAADVIENPRGQSYSIVQTAKVMEQTATVIKHQEHVFVCANVQETDLCGHRQRADKYAEILQIADAGIGKLLSLLDGEDILVVMADHGNDPTIGHSRHTRERVPLLFAGSGLITGNIGERTTLSDVAATAAAFFNAAMPQNGTPIALRGQ